MAEADPIRRLIHQLSRLPGVGEKTATRLAFHLLRADRAICLDLARALEEVSAQVGLCGRCANLAAIDPCPTCRDERRTDDTICVVERPQDQWALERAPEYRGRFHVLHGALDPLSGIGPEQLQIASLLHRLAPAAVREVILATNPTVEGEATALYLARLLKPLGVKVTRIAQGVALGSEIEYADQGTLSRALAHRHDFG
ncbi:recombination mediator RecR [Myxococcota bacterium]|nr:recombination mediator RecR [Myxococcota bacterium]